MRGAGAVIALLWAALLLRDAPRAVPAKLGAAFLVSSAFALMIHTGEGAAPPAGVRAVLLPVSSSWIVFLWLAARSFFDDDFRLRLADGAVLAVWISLGAVNYADLVAMRPLSEPWAAFARSVISYALVAHIIYVALKGVGPDLVEARRRSRVGFALGLLSVYALNRVGELVFGYDGLPLWVTTGLYALVSGLFAAGFAASVRLDAAALGWRGTGARQTAEPEDISGDDRAAIDRLTRLMEIECAYREPTLSIRDLAARADVSEHKLRALINRTMGHSNFRAFLNGYRIRDAVSALKDPARNDVAILTIAMDAGFGSLSSFNRAFRRETGVSPSDMRAQAQKTPSETE